MLGLWPTGVVISFVKTVRTKEQSRLVMAEYPALIANMTTSSDFIPNLVLNKRSVNFTRQQIEEWCKQAIESIDVCIKVNTAAEKQTDAGINIGDKIGYWAIWRNSLAQAKRSGHNYITHYVHDFKTQNDINSFLSYSRQYISTYTAQLVKARGLAEELLQRMQSGKAMLKNSYAVTIKPRDPKDSHHLLIALAREENVRCDRCQAILNVQNLADHQLTEKCRDRVELKKLQASGFVYTSNAAIKKGIRQGIIPGRMIPCDYDYYIPKWVHDAIALYNKDQGYAGMKICDFIQKMRPDSEKQ